MTAFVDRFRFVAVYSLDFDVLGVEPDSVNDVALLRLANAVLQRAQAGRSDCVVFLLPHATDLPKAQRVFERYGFINYWTIVDHFELENGFDDDDQARKSRADVMQRWLQANHPGAIPTLNPSVFGNEFLWWAGIETTEGVERWEFSIERFAELLPNAHRPRAATWIAVAVQICEITLGSMPTGMNQQTERCYLAALAYWLHGFEGASGNGFNEFDASAAIDALQISPFFLGFEFAHLFDGAPDWDKYLGDVDDDFDELPKVALKEMLDTYRPDLHLQLVKFFGSKPALFWALHSSIWPNFLGPAAELCQDLLNPGDDEIADRDTAWQFVDDGWVDAADDG